MDQAIIHPFSFQKKLQKYLAAIRVNMTNTKTLSVNIFAKCLAVLFRVWIFTQLYEATFAETGATTIGDFTLPMVIWSLMLTQSFESASRPPVGKIISLEVQDGTLANSVSKPYSYLLFHFWSTVGRTLPMLLSSIIIGAGIAYVLVGLPHFSFWGIVCGSINLLLGFVLDFTMSLIIGIAALWLEDISSVMNIYHKFRLVFGGLILPIALFPGTIKTITELLPFSQLYYSAARQVVAFDLTTFINSVAIQLFWITIFGLLAAIIYSRGMKQLSVNGG